MTLSIVIGRRPGEKSPATVFGPDDPRAARDAYMALLTDPGGLEFIALGEIHLVRRKTFQLPQVGTPLRGVQAETPPSDPQSPAPPPEPGSGPGVDEDGDGPSLGPKKATKSK